MVAHISTQVHLYIPVRPALVACKDCVMHCVSWLSPTCLSDGSYFGTWFYTKSCLFALDLKERVIPF